MRRSQPWLRFGLALVTLGLASPLLSQENSASRLTFVKVFEGSTPEYTRVTAEENGKAAYQGGTVEEPGEPESLQLSAELTSRLFSLAAELNYFDGIELDAGGRVANMGQKKFIYEKAGQRHEVTYNYTRNDAADELQALFEGLARGRYLVQQLEQRIVFDRLGLPDSLTAFQREFNAGRLVDLEQFVPILKKIAEDPRLMGLVRSQARALLQRIEGGAASLYLEHGDQESGWYYKLVLVNGGSTTMEARRFDAPPNPRILALSEVTVQRLWELAQLGNYFRPLVNYRDLPGRLSGYRFTYQAGATHHQVAFTTPPDAIVGEMVHLFQQTLQQEYYRERLRSALEDKEKPFMLQVVLQELERAVGSDKLVDPGEFEPLLEGIASGEDHHAVVREKAERLLARIRALSQ
jgi:hypothetical protein